MNTALIVLGAWAIPSILYVIWGYRWNKLKG